MADINEPVDSAGPSQTEALIDAFKSGEAKLGGTTRVEEEPAADAAPESEDFNPSEFLDNIKGEAANDETESDEDGDLSADSDSETPSDDSEPEAVGDIEELLVTGTKGRRKVKVDFSDRDKLKKHVQMAYGARKWQAERDEARSNLGQAQAELKELKGDWEKLESAYASSGIEGVVNLLEGNDGAYQSFLQSEIEKQQRFASMSDSEREAYDLEQARIAQDKENQKLRDEYEAKLKEISERQEQAEMRSMESKLHPAFDRYRFKDRLGDPVAETEFDEMLWNRALKNLETISDDVELTQAIVDKEFRRISTTMKKHFNTQVERRTKKAVSKQKQAATKKVQATVSKGMKDSAEAAAFRDSMKSGDFVSGLTSFFKAGGKLNKD
jgi:hypothetical protein